MAPASPDRLPSLDSSCGADCLREWSSLLSTSAMACSMAPSPSTPASLSTPGARRKERRREEEWRLSVCPPVSTSTLQTDCDTNYTSRSGYEMSAAVSSRSGYEMSAAVRSSYDAKQEGLELRERALARQVCRPAASCGALMRALRAMRFYSYAIESRASSLARLLARSLSFSLRARLCCSRIAGSWAWCSARCRGWRAWQEAAIQRARAVAHASPASYTGMSSLYLGERQATAGISLSLSRSMLVARTAVACDARRLRPRAPTGLL